MENTATLSGCTEHAVPCMLGGGNSAQTGTDWHCVFLVLVCSVHVSGYADKRPPETALQAPAGRLNCVQPPSLHTVVVCPSTSQTSDVQGSGSTAKHVGISRALPFNMSSGASLLVQTQVTLIISTFLFDLFSLLFTVIYAAGLSFPISVLKPPSTRTSLLEST